MTSKQGAYGAAGVSDTDHRRKFDRAEYAEKAASREAAEKDERKARYEAKLAGKKYYAPLTGTETLTEARANRLNVGGNVGKTMLVPAGASMGKRGRGAGFYCEACDLTFKDNVQWVDHENSMQHLRNIGQTGEVRRATAEEVRERIERLWEELEESRREGKTLEERLEVRKEDEEREREAKRAKRMEIARRKREEKEREEEKAKVKTEDMYGEDVRVDGIHDDEDMMAMLGMTGFGSSKK